MHAHVNVETGESCLRDENEGMVMCQCGKKATSMIMGAESCKIGCYECLHGRSDEIDSTMILNRSDNQELEVEYGGGWPEGMNNRQLIGTRPQDWSMKFSLPED